jgi:hypothetical protein
MIKQAVRVFLLTIALLGASLVFAEELIVTALILTTIGLTTVALIMERSGARESMVADDQDAEAGQVEALPVIAD